MDHSIDTLIVFIFCATLIWTCTGGNAGTADDDSHTHDSKSSHRGRSWWWWRFHHLRHETVSEARDILETLWELLAEPGRLQGEDVDMVSDTLRNLSCCGTEPDVGYDELRNITQLYTMVLGQLLHQDNMDGWRNSKLGVRALPSLFRSVETFARCLGVQLLAIKEDHNIVFIEGNFEIGMFVTDAREDLIAMKLASANVEVDLEDILRERVVVFILYRELGDVFPENNRWLQDAYLSSVLFGSDILNTAVYSLLDDTEDIDNISMTFHLLNGIGNGNVACKYWEVENSSETGGHWSSDGCNVTERDDSTVSCVCNHLTNFAILIQVADIVISNEHLRALGIISYVGCSLSLLGACLSVMTFTCLRITKDRVLIHLNLALSIIGAQVIFMVEDVVPRDTVGCTITIVLLFYFHMCVFCWMLVEGIQLYLQVVVVFSTENKMKSYYALGWGLPVIVVGVGMAVVQGNVGQHDICWLSPRDRSILVFVIPAMLIVMVNMIVLGLVMRVLLRLSETTGHRKLHSVRRAVKASVSLLPILGGTWLFGVLAVSEDMVVFQYLFALTNSVQGFLIFVCHCVNSTEVREAFVRHKNNWKLSRHLASKNRVSHGTGISKTPPHGFTSVRDTAESVRSDGASSSDSTKSTSINTPTGSDPDLTDGRDTRQSNNHIWYSSGKVCDSPSTKE